MNKEQLEQLISLRAEIIELGKEIKALREMECEIVSDKVQASSREWPYISTNKKIIGYDIQGISKRNAAIKRKQDALEVRKAQAEELESEITIFINSVQNSQIRRILHARYEKGLTWEQIGKEMNCDRTTVEKRLSRFLRET